MGSGLRMLIVEFFLDAIMSALPWPPLLCIPRQFNIPLIVWYITERRSVFFNVNYWKHLAGCRPCRSISQELQVLFSDQAQAEQGS